MSDRLRLLGVIQKYVPNGTEEYATDLLLTHRIHLHIKPPRVSKLGDYRAPRHGENHRISVNNDLNQYAFLITFLHEVAHLLTFEKHRGFVSPHGLEWKQHFQNVSVPVLTEKVLPADVQHALHSYLINPKASSCSSPLLIKTLRRYDDHADNEMLVEDIPENTVFAAKDGRKFIKGPRIRTRYRCKELSTGKVYLVPGLMPCQITLA